MSIWERTLLKEVDQDTEKERRRERERGWRGYLVRGSSLIGDLYSHKRGLSGESESNAKHIN